MNIFILKTSLIISAVACTQVYNAALAQKSNPRSGYQSINVQQFVSANQISVSTPNQVGVQLFRETEEIEGRKSETVSITYPTPNTAIIMHTEEGLADDSVAAMRHRLELQRRQNKWQIIWVGRQTKCQPGRGHQNWSSKLCS